MVRTQVYLTQQEKAGLNALARTSGKKQSELIREAVDHLIAQFSKTRQQAVLDCAAVIWKERKDLPDFAAVRKAWDRDRRL